MSFCSLRPLAFRRCLVASGGLLRCRSPALSRTYTLRSTQFIPTKREAPHEAAIPSYGLLVRGGYIRKAANGTYMLLPLAMRVLERVESIVDEELARMNCTKLKMPSLISKQDWELSGRWDKAGAELFRLKDRRGEDYCLGPTHEELFTSLVASTVTSYKQLPVRLYQIGPKYRDEIRPRFGLQRAREFIMKDLYTFDATVEEAQETYKEVQAAYHRIFSRLGVPFKEVEADTGQIGGKLSHEFHILSKVGEDTLLTCSSCGYAANAELAPSISSSSEPSVADLPMVELVAIAKGIEAAKWGVKVEVFEYEEPSQGTSLVIVAVPDGRTANPVKLKAHIDISHLKEIAVGAIDRKEFHSTIVFLDEALAGMRLSHGEAELTVHRGDFKTAEEGDPCTCGTGSLSALRGIEVGHVFYLGTTYSKPMGAQFVGKDQVKRDIEMGCYGLGISRILSGIVESSHDAKGIIWPAAVAPYRACILTVGGKKQKTDDPAVAHAQELARDLSGCLRPQGTDVLLDDRYLESFGTKMTEAELLGYPYIIIVGKKFLSDGKYELHDRAAGSRSFVSAEELKQLIKC